MFVFYRLWLCQIIVYYYFLFISSLFLKDFMMFHEVILYAEVWKTTVKGESAHSTVGLGKTSREQSKSLLLFHRLKDICSWKLTQHQCELCYFCILKGFIIFKLIMFFKCYWLKDWTILINYIMVLPNIFVKILSGIQGSLSLLFV